MSNDDAKAIEHILASWTVNSSGHDERRDYLGMSGIGDCPLEQYRRFVSGQHFPPSALLRTHAGYVWERSIKERLAACGLLFIGGERELVALFDSRFRGHTDGEIAFNGRRYLLEIKSVVDFVLSETKSKGIPKRHWMQVQAYEHFGGYDEAMILYVARDSGRLYLAAAERNAAAGRDIEERAKRILEAIDLGKPPACECGKCK